MLYFLHSNIPKMKRKEKRTMSTPHLIQTICEILVAAFLIWGLFHEDILVDFEKRLFKKMKPCFKAVKDWIIGG